MRVDRDLPMITSKQLLNFEWEQKKRRLLKDLIAKKCVSKRDKVIKELLISTYDLIPKP
jgi:hypothetical protein